MGYHQSIAATCEQATAALSHILIAQGYRLERSFDLRSALRDQRNCPCPYHGASDCECQYLVLLAYRQGAFAPPIVITAHECEGITHLSIESAQLQVDPALLRLSFDLEEGDDLNTDAPQALAIV
jgi:hypothetical protein